MLIEVWWAGLEPTPYGHRRNMAVPPLIWSGAEDKAWGLCLLAWKGWRLGAWEGLRSAAVDAGLSSSGHLSCSKSKSRPIHSTTPSFRYCWSVRSPCIQTPCHLLSFIHPSQICCIPTIF